MLLGDNGHNNGKYLPLNFGHISKLVRYPAKCACSKVLIIYYLLLVNEPGPVTYNHLCTQSWVIAPRHWAALGLASLSG